MHAFAPRMDQGRVINISSGASRAPQFGRASYAVTKRALEALSEFTRGCARKRLGWTGSSWSSRLAGYTATLGEGNYEGFEDPVIMSDAGVLARRAADRLRNVLTITKMREMGVVRGVTQGWSVD